MDSIKELLNEGKRDASRSFATALSTFVFIGGLAYAEIHNAHLLFNGLPKGWEFLAWIALVCMGATAVALHFAGTSFSRSVTLRIAATAFFWADLGLMTANTIVDYAVNTGEKLPDWAQIYTFYVLPAGPILCVVGWAILAQLDPRHKHATNRAAIQGAEEGLEAELDGLTRLTYLAKRREYVRGDAELRALLTSTAIRDQLRSTHAMLGINEAPQFPTLEMLPQPQRPASVTPETVKHETPSVTSKPAATFAFQMPRVLSFTKRETQPARPTSAADSAAPEDETPNPK